MKVLVSDKMSQNGIDILDAADGIQVVYKTNLSPEDLIKENCLGFWIADKPEARSERCRRVERICC